MEMKGLDLLKIRLLPGEFKYKEGTKMEGQTYRRYTTGGKVFISNDDTFKTCVEEGGLYSATLATDEEDRLFLTDFITWKQVKGQRRNEVEYESITVENFKPSSVGELEGLA